MATRTATCCCRRRTRAGRAAGSRSTRREPATQPSRRRSSGPANSMASFLLDWPSTVQRDLKVFDEPGTKHWASFLVRPGQVAGALERHRRPGPALGVLHAARRASKAQGSLANYDPTTNHASAWRATATLDNALNVKKNFKNFAPRTGVSWRLNQQTVVRAGYGASTIPFPDNRYAFNYPVKQNYSGIGGQRLPARRARWRPGFPAPALLDIPVERHHPGRPGRPAELDVRRHPAGPARGHAALLERRVPAAAAVPAHRRHRLRRQPRRRPRDGRQHQRQPGLRLGQQRPAAVRAVQPHRRRRARAPTTTSRSTTGCR